MELRQRLINVPTRPIVLLAALFCAIAIALVGWYTLGATATPRVYNQTVNAAGGFPGPDARDRNAQLNNAHQTDAETTHGH